MEVIARVELGMTSEDFFSCAWYDWSLWMEKIRHDREKSRSKDELIMEMTRQVLSYTYNWNRSKNDQVIQPQDFWKLSYDKSDIQSAPEDLDTLQETIKRLERATKKRKGG
jgi:hypothetical protein